MKTIKRVIKMDDLYQFSVSAVGGDMNNHNNMGEHCPGPRMINQSSDPASILVVMPHAHKCAYVTGPTRRMLAVGRLTQWFSVSLVLWFGLA